MTVLILVIKKTTTQVLQFNKIKIKMERGGVFHLKWMLKPVNCGYGYEEKEKN